MQNSKLLQIKLERCNAENKRLQDLLEHSASNGLSNDEIHQFNNVAALLDANMELALDAVQTLSENKGLDNSVEIITITNFIIASQKAKTELVDIING